MSNLQEQVKTGDSKFTKLNVKAEEKKINLFYLKDLLIKEGVTPQEKTEILFKLKRNVFKSVFGSAIKALLTEFEKIKEVFIQVEVMQMIAISGQV